MNYSGSGMEKLILLYKSIQGCLKDVSQGYEFTVSEMEIMLELYENKTLSLNELSEKIGLPKSSVSRLVESLVNRGYVSRVIPTGNRRSVELSVLVLNCVEELCDNEVLLKILKQGNTDKILSIMQELSEILVKQKHD